MKRLKKIAYIILIIIIIVLSLTIYVSANKKNDNNQKEKSLSEIRYVESTLVNLLNTMNNIEIRNYDVSISQISKENTEKLENNSGGSSSSSGESSTNSSSGDSETSNTDSSSSSSGGDTSNSTGSENTGEENKKYEMNLNGVLTNSKDINWDIVKSKTEIMYSSIPTITMDLYQINLNQEDILNFNKEFDNLTIVAKDEKKEETLAQLAKLYEFMPKFANNATDDELYKKVIETKSHIFNAYSKLDSNDWNQIQSEINKAIEVYSQLLSNTNIPDGKQYSVSKGYIMLNEMQNAVNLKDIEVFLIKYKNLIEELNSL